MNSDYSNVSFDLLTINEKDFIVKKINKIELRLSNAGKEEKSIDFEGESVSPKFLKRINKFYGKIK